MLATSLSTKRDSETPGGQFFEGGSPSLDCYCTPSGRSPRGADWPSWVCAVKRWRFPVGASPTRQPLQPEATGAAMEVTKWLKPSVMRFTNW